MSRVDREAVEPVILGVYASGVPVERRFGRGVSSIGYGEMVPRRFLSKAYTEQSYQGM